MFELHNVSSIGNGCTDESKLFRAYHDMQCTPICGPPINTIEYALYVFITSTEHSDPFLAIA